MLLERIASGGMAEVYRAKASGAGGFEKELAVKRILPSYTNNDDFRRMFEYEARLSSQLTHANIVQIYDFVKAGDTYLLSMEFVDGKNLRQVVNKVKKNNFILPIELSVFIINEVCKGLEYAHSKKDSISGKSLNVIHRDMSPQNIMLSYDGAVKIVDFGIAKAKDRVDETRSGVIKGKFGYMSPEQANGIPVDHRSDIFSTGIILFELLTGKRLFATDNDLATLKLIQECVIPSPVRINPKIPVELEKILLKALTKDLKLRYQSAGSFHRNLQEFLNKNYSTLTQNDVANVLGKVFANEISAEKKRFEAIHRQSIPFSQQNEAKASPEDLGEIEDALDEEVTKSEYESDTAVTFGEEVSQKVDKTTEDRQSTVAATKKVAAEKTEISVDHADATLAQGDPTFAEPKSFDKTEIKTPTPVAVEEKAESIKVAETPVEEKKSEKSIELEDGDTSPEAMPVLNQDTVVTGSEVDDILDDVTGETNVTEPPVDEITEKPTRRRDRSISLMNSYARKEPQINTRTPTNSSTQSSFIMDPAPNASDTEPPRSRNGLDLQIERPKRSRAPQRPTERFDEQPRRSSGAPFFLLVFVALGLTAYMYRLLFTKSVVPTVAQMIEPRDVTNAAKPSIEPNTIPTAPPEGECVVRIDSDPAGGKVYINGNLKGKTPISVSVKCAKDLNLEMRNEGYENINENVFIRNRENKLFKSMKKIPMGEVELVLSRNAEVSLDGEIVGEAMANQSFVVKMKAGVRHRLRFKNDIFGVDTFEDVLVEEGFRPKKILRLEESRRKPTGK